MNQPQAVQRRIRVSSIRSANPIGQGGYIFYGAAIHLDGTAINNEHFVVSVPNRLTAYEFIAKHIIGPELLASQPTLQTTINRIRGWTHAA